METLGVKGVRYGLERLSKAIAENAHASAKDIAASVRHDLENFAGYAEPRDDWTLLVMKIRD